MIHTIEQAKRRNAAAGQTWFGPAELRFFGTRIAPTVYPVPDGMLFVTSETPDAATRRRYSVRFISDEGKVSTLGEFRQYSTSPQARGAAQAEQHKRLGGMSYAEWQDQQAEKRELCDHGYVIGQDSCPVCDADE